MVADTLPAGLTATALSGPGWVCLVVALRCARTDVLAAGASYPPITLTVDVAPNALAAMSNVATVSGGGETNTVNNTATDLIPVIQFADLTIAKSHSGSFVPGRTGAAYTITVTNLGPGSTTGTVTVTDTLPAGVTATAIAGPGWTCVLATLTCTRSDVLAAGASYPPITLTVNISLAATGILVDRVAVSGGGERNTTNNTAVDPAFATPVPDVTITKSHAGSFKQGQTGAQYTIIATNVGSGATTGTVTVSDTLPAGLTATALAGPGWTRPRHAELQAKRLPRCRRELPADHAHRERLARRERHPGEPDQRLGRRRREPREQHGHGPGADPPGSRPHARQDQVGGLPSRRHGHLHHRGHQCRDGALNRPRRGDRRPSPGLTATSASGPGWACTTAPLACRRSNALAPGQSYPPITIEVNVARTVAGTLANTATVAGGGDTNPANNRGSLSGTFLAAPDLAIEKLRAGELVPGQSVSYSIVVRNVSTVPHTQNVTVADILPSGLTATAIAGDGWSCSLSTLRCSRSDPLGPGASYPAITVTVDVSPNASGTLTNRAAVFGAGKPNLLNNAAQDLTRLVPPEGPTAIPTLSFPMLLALAITLGLAARMMLRRAG